MKNRFSRRKAKKHSPMGRPQGDQAAVDLNRPHRFAEPAMNRYTAPKRLDRDRNPPMQPQVTTTPGELRRPEVYAGLCKDRAYRSAVGIAARRPIVIPGTPKKK